MRTDSLTTPVATVDRHTRSEEIRRNLALYDELHPRNRRVPVAVDRYGDEVRFDWTVVFVLAGFGVACVMMGWLL